MTGTCMAIKNCEVDIAVGWEVLILVCHYKSPKQKAIWRHVRVLRPEPEVSNGIAMLNYPAFQAIPVLR